MLISAPLAADATDLPDSLQLQLDRADPEKKVEILNDLAWKYRNSDPEKALEFGGQALIFASENQELRALSLRRLGLIHKNLGTYDSARAYFMEALTIEENRQNDPGIASTCNGLGTLAQRQGDFGQAQSYFQRSLEIYQRQELHLKAARVCNNLGNTLRNLGDYDEALKYYLEGLGQLESKKELEPKEKHVLADIHNSLGNFHDIRENHVEALKHYQKSQQIREELGDERGLGKVYNNLGIQKYKLGDFTQALEYYRLSLDIKTKLKDRRGIADSYNNIGLILEEQGNLSEARSNYENGLKIYQDLEDRIGIAILYSNMGSVLLKEGQTTAGRSNYLKSLAMADTIGDLALVRDVSLKLSSLYESEGNAGKSLQYYKQYFEAERKLFNEESQGQIAEMQARYEAEEKARRIQLLEQEKKLQEVELENEKQQKITQAREKNGKLNMMMLGIALLSVLLVLVVIIYRQKIKGKEFLAAKNAEAHRQKVDDLLYQSEINSMSAMVSGQEKERQRLAAELHDRLGSILSTIKYHFSALETLITAKKQYTQIDFLIDEACREVRSMAHQMATGILARFGLVAALNELSQQLASTQQLKMHVVTHGLEERLESTREIAIYRMIQELMSNVLKHAQATEVYVSLTRNETSLNIMVEDNGIGFDPKTEGRNGLGISNVGERVKEQGGEFSIDSFAGRGTTVTIDLPCPEENKEAL